MNNKITNKDNIKVVKKIINILDASKKQEYAKSIALKSDFSYFFFNEHLFEIVCNEKINGLAGKDLAERKINELLIGIAQFNDEKILRRLERLFNTIKLYQKSIELHQIGQSAFEDYSSEVLKNSMAVNRRPLYPDFFVTWRPYMTEFKKQGRDLAKEIQKIADKKVKKDGKSV